MRARIADARGHTIAYLKALNEAQEYLRGVDEAYIVAP